MTCRVDGNERRLDGLRADLADGWPGGIELALRFRHYALKAARAVVMLVLLVPAGMLPLRYVS